MEIHPPHGSIQSLKDFLIALATITAGVLIALSLEGLLEWNHNRRLVREARETVTREITDNKKEVDGILASAAARQNDLDNALRLANELLNSKKSDIRQVNLGTSIAELSSAGWQSAERTGALTHMDYAEVQKYAGLYELQNLFAVQQRQVLGRLASALAVLGAGDPHTAAPRDLELFRQHVLGLRADLIIERQLGQGLSEAYGKSLAH
jgi:hypothetical protein